MGLKVEGGHSFKNVIERIEFIAEREKAKTNTKRNNDQIVEKSIDITTSQTKFIEWPDDVRGMPNAILRSALFTATKREKRIYCENMEIYAQEGIRIKYTGLRLDMDDCDVWENALHIAREQALGEVCSVTPYEFLQLMDKPDTGGYRRFLDSSLSRMNATAVEITVTGKNGFSYEGSLIMSVTRSKETGYLIQFDPKLLPLFSKGQFTHIDWKIRKLLSKKPIAQWLHGYYSSHAKPYPVKIETLKMMSGSKNKAYSSSKQNVENALESLAAANKVCNQHFSFEIINELVYVMREPSKSQGRHLKRMSLKNKIPY